MSSETVDLLIVGAGITGAGIARDAAMRGLRTAIVDKSDFASGTSGKSSRLVHGGLRYLEMGDLHLVFEASAERKTLLRIAPHLVHPRSFIFPVYRNSRVPKWKLSIGLWAYDVLSLFRNVQRHEMLSKREILEAEPELNAIGLVGGARYYDAQCDDARLALATLRSAHQHGALVANYATVDDFVQTDGKVTGARITDELTGETFSVEARVVVNATGPWSDNTRGDGKTALRPTKGAHILVPRSRLGNNEAITLTSVVDGRVMFVIPWGKYSYVGTTDTDDEGTPEELEADMDDVEYLLESANALFPHARLTPGDVLSTWAGFRPLLRPNDPKDPSSVSREHRILESDSGLISIVGGKLTTYRKMGEEVVDAVIRRLGKSHGNSFLALSGTDRELLPGGDVRPDELDAELKQQGFTAETAHHLLCHYGSDARSIVELCTQNSALRTFIASGHPALMAELIYCCRREMAVTLCDLLIRRMHVFYETFDHGSGCLEQVARTVGEELGWSARERQSQVALYRAEMAKMEQFRKSATAPVGSEGGVKAQQVESGGLHR